MDLSLAQLPGLLISNFAKMNSCRCDAMSVQHCAVSADHLMDLKTSQDRGRGIDRELRSETKKLSLFCKQNSNYSLNVVSVATPWPTDENVEKRARIKYYRIIVLRPK